MLQRDSLLPYQQPTLSTWEQIVASSIGGIFTVLAVTPLDVVKTRLQAQNMSVSSKSHHSLSSASLSSQITSSKKISSGSKLKFHGTLDAFNKIGKHEGLRSLYRGLSPALVMTVPSTTIYFTCYETFRNHLTEDLGFWSPMVAGITARTVAVTITSPIDLFRTNIQSHARNVGSIKLFKDIVSSGRISTFWVGVRPTLWRDVPFSGIYWTLFEVFRTEIIKSRQSHNKYVTNFCAGALAGSMAAFVTMPFDVVKTRSQMNVDKLATSSNVHQVTKSTFATLANIWSREGPKALFQGLLPRVGKVAPACAIMISTYEFLKEAFLKRA